MRESKTPKLVKQIGDEEVSMADVKKCCEEELNVHQGEGKSEEKSESSICQETANCDTTGKSKARIGIKKEETVLSINKEIPRGKPKSGRVWKENKKRFSSMVKDRSLCTSWDIKMKERHEKKMLKSLAGQLKDEKKREKEEKRKRREENLRRRLENERKSEIVQVIRNPAKLKRARKKQLRNIEKRDTLKMSQTGKKRSAKEMTPSVATVKKKSATS